MIRVFLPFHELPSVDKWSYGSYLYLYGNKKPLDTFSLSLSAFRLSPSAIPVKIRSHILLLLYFTPTSLIA